MSTLRCLLIVVITACSSEHAAPQPVPPPAVTTCADAIDHAQSLMALGSQQDANFAVAAIDLRDHRAQHIAECERSMNPDDIACVMRAKTALAIGTCPPPGGQ